MSDATFLKQQSKSNRQRELDLTSPMCDMSKYGCLQKITLLIKSFCKWGGYEDSTKAVDRFFLEAICGTNLLNSKNELARELETSVAILSSYVRDYGLFCEMSA